ncbi:MAG TPA: CGNR zinc finger domain-containing protein [Candidatus Limnocylindria bacterium]|nr:CGNR zinc finger domain-containing protein [Candidatus Limnocylindria bacterium]
MSLIHEIPPEPQRSDELFVAFANTLHHERGAPVDDIGDLDALLAWLRDHHLLSGRARATETARLHRDPGDAGRRLQRFRRLRDVLHAVAEDIGANGRISPAHLGELNHILRHGLHYHQLRHMPDGARYSVAQVGDRLDQARATIASSLAQFLADGAAHRLRICANQGCREVFIDRSPTGRRRWCDMRTCGNQAKVARHRARARQMETSTAAE